MPADDRTCLNLTAAQKAELEALGWTTLSSGHLTEAECLTACERPSWYCVDEYVYTNNQQCNTPCQTGGEAEPNFYRFSHESSQWVDDVRLVRVSCSSWAHEAFPLVDPPTGYNWLLFYRVTHARFELWLLSIQTGAYNLWICDAGSWECMGVNTLTQAGTAAFPGFSSTITIHPD